MICNDLSEPILFLFNVDTPAYIYYSHFTALISSLLLSIYIFSKSSRDNLARNLLYLSATFFAWIILSLITWTNINSDIIMFVWSLNVIMYLFIIYFSFNFYSLLVRKTDSLLKEKIMFLLLASPLIFLTPGVFNLTGFNYTYCEALENKTFFLYTYLFGFVTILYMFNIYLKYRNNKQERKKIFFQFISIALFLAIFFIMGFLGTFADNYILDQIGLYGKTIFMGLLAYLIVRFKAFNIKLLGAQALVWALIILVGSQFLYQAEMPVSSLILTAITLVISSLIGLLVIRSVKKIDHQRELLDLANKNQQAILHFITHQVKGYLTKSRNIFDGMVGGDYDPISDKALEIAKHGFDSDTRGVETVMAILRASDLKTGKTEFKKEKANVSALVAKVIEERKDSAIQKGLDLTFEIEPNIETKFDQLQIKEVFKNLITNSILYTQKGTIHIELKREEGKVKFSVIDTGFGLSLDDKAKLFTEGGKGEDSSKINVDSTGYGLYIAKHIMDRHEGTIQAFSEGRNKGSEFVVVLPDMR